MPDTPWTTIPQLVDSAAAQFDDTEALVDGDLRLTYSDLAERIHEASRALMARGIGPGDRVAIWAPNIWEWVVAALGVHCAGAVLVPVNTRFKGREAAYVLDRAQVRLLFTVSGFLDTDYVKMLAEAGGGQTIEEIVVLRSSPSAGSPSGGPPGETGASPPGPVSFAEFLAGAASVDDADRAARSAQVTGDDLAHILFTSGTTGAPKGAMLEHRQVCRAYLDFTEVIGLQYGDRYLVSNPFFHSFGLQAGILCCLMKGSTIIPLIVFDPEAVSELIERERVTAYPGPPSVFLTLIDHPARQHHDLSSLRLVILGAAAIPVELIRRIRDELGLESVVTGYGITESTGIVAMCRYDDDPEIIATTSGRAIPGVAMKIVDDAGTELPSGEQGEILVQGHTIMRGYLDDPEQTAEVIDPDGWFRTGDIGYLTEGGNVVLTDRKKDMFIVGGFNAYPAEIENLMSSHPSVGQVAVIGVPDERLGEVGLAFVIRRPGTEATEAEIVAWCRDQMANYKAPRHVRFVDSLPLNASGKVLKYELREQVAADEVIAHTTDL